MATRKYRLQSPVRSTSSGERIIVHHQIVKTKSIINHIHVPIYELIALGKIKEAKLLKEIIKFYKVVIEKRRKKPVFEPWMFTTDSCNQTSFSFLNRISKLALNTTVNILSTIFFGTALIISGGFFTNLTAQNDPPKTSKMALVNYDAQSPVNYTLQNDSSLISANSNMLCRDVNKDEKRGVGTKLNEQNQITGTIKSVPTNDRVKGKITLEDINTQKKYSKEIDSLTGQFTLNVPERTYKRQIEAINNYLFIDTLNINTDTVLNKEIIITLPVNSQIYQGYNINSLNLFKILTATRNGDISQTIHRWIPTNGDITIIPTFLRRYNPNDPISMPQGWALQYDTLMNYLTNNNPINDKLQLEEKTINDSLHNIHHYYVINNQMPIPGSLGYTLRFQENNILKYSKIFMNRQALAPEWVVQTGLREFVRSFGLESNSIDPLFVMYMSGNSNRQFHPDEINILRTLYSLTPGTDMFPYKDSVITVVNMPPIVTAPLPDLNIFEGANETFLAKLSQHFRDPENSPLNYISYGENIIITLRNDSLFIKPAEWFSGITNLVVEAYEGNGQFVSDTSEINVIHINYPPTVATLTNPAEGDTIKTANYTFKWTRSTDQNGDPLTYKIILTGTKDTTITGITDTLYQINNIQGELPPGNYTGKIETSDGIDSTISQANNFYITTVTGVQNEMNTLNKFILSQNYPNPFNSTTMISYSLPKTAGVKILVYNSLGETVANLVDETRSPDYYEVAFNSASLPSGVYFYKIECISTDGSERFRSVKKMIILK